MLGTIPAFAGETADHNNCNVRQMLLHRQQVPGKALALLSFLVRHLFHTGAGYRCGKMRIKAHKSERRFLHFQPVVKVVHIGNHNITASAATFYIVEAAFAEKGDACALSKRKQVFLIF